jgi:thiol-disulfide isomerase/thioredoxin
LGRIQTQQEILPKGLKMQFKKISLFLIFCTIIFTGCDSKQTNTNEQNIKNAIAQENNTYDLSLQTMNDTTMNATVTKNNIVFDTIKNKVILVNFFATWCPPCKAEIPHLNKLKEKYPNDFEVVAVLLEKHKTKADIQAFMDEYNINYVVTLDENNFTFADAFGGVKSIPTMYLLSPKGDIVQKYVGIVLEEMLEIDIKRAMEK